MVTIVTYFLMLKRTRKIYFKQVVEQYKGNIKKLMLPLPLKKSRYNPFLLSTSGSTLPLRVIKTKQYLQVDKNRYWDSLPSCNMQVTRNKYNLYNIQPKVGNGQYLLFSGMFNKLYRKVLDISRQGVTYLTEEFLKHSFYHYKVQKSITIIGSTYPRVKI